MSGRAMVRGKVAVVSIGETQAPEAEFKLARRAILAVCEDAGLDPRALDGFASSSNDRNDPSPQSGETAWT
jgi:cobalamin biosynthesis protein CbiG